MKRRCMIYNGCISLYGGKHSTSLYMVMERRGALPESRVVEMWRDCLPAGRELVTESGDPVRIIYPGRRNRSHGADFLDAVIATGHGLVTGDIEVHVRSSGWRAHKHYLDPAYNRVVMHVVYHNDTDADARLHNGRSVPTLALDKLSGKETGHGRDNGILPCRRAISRLKADGVGAVLEAAGEERFHARTGEFRRHRAGPGQALYEGIMAALGYARNKSQFLTLARSVPLKILESNIRGETTEDACLAHVQSVLLGAAGLLPSQRPQMKTAGGRAETCVNRLEKIWKVTGRTAVLSAGDWHVSGTRPGNIPVRRIAAMSYLLLRYRRDGLLAGLSKTLYPGETGTGYSQAENSLVVNAEGYWARNLDFHLPVRNAAPALLGRGRASDIVINVLLPFAAATISEDRALEMYRSYPRLETNTLERHMLQQLGLDRKTANSACRQQGLIHIYRTLCSRGKCGECQLGHKGRGAFYR
jgi:hypothetical protein